jgi:hypothetical protein
MNLPDWEKSFNPDSFSNEQCSEVPQSIRKIVAAQEVRDHEDIPLAELTSLAASLRVAGHTTRRTAEESA